ncbi:hypothetical protein SSX86_001891 [Deinandra increscens subsp. villosa]|uniref:Uncharacterized protein n=1 Tax=Deinandra increscens subsp. villosa TaxID=3103831 RepID=A0AAP0DSB1_9ASTR
MIRGIREATDDRVLLMVLKDFTQHDSEYNQVKRSPQTPNEATKNNNEVQQKGDNNPNSVTNKSSGKHGKQLSSLLYGVVEVIEVNDMLVSAGMGFLQSSKELGREGAPKERELLCGRIIDRPIRLLFPVGFNHEVQLNPSDLNLVYACTRYKTMMIDVQAHEISEKDLEAAFRFAHPKVVKFIEPQLKLAAKAGKKLKK